MRRTVTVVPEAGLHARPASAFVEAAAAGDADVRIAPADGGDEALVNAESMLSVTALGVESGEDVLLVADGSDDSEGLRPPNSRKSATSGDSEAALDACERVLTTPEGEPTER